MLGLASTNFISSLYYKNFTIVMTVASTIKLGS
jgi:hypothetical protein